MSKFSNFIILVCLFIPLNYQADGATKKSWKPAVNFDEDIPKLTPFDEESFGGGQQETLADPAPSPETFPEEASIKTPYRSKVKSALHKPHKKSHKLVEGLGEFHVDDPDVDETYQEPLHDDVQEKKPEKSDIESIVDDFIEANLDSVDEEDGKQSEETVEEKPTAPKISHYNVGHLMNVTVDEKDNQVDVKFDQHTLKEIITGRGKKYGIMERVLPLFILPFLIQTAVVPFIVTTIKLFLIKSVFAGKIAIFLLLLGALKNHQNSLYMKSLQTSPYFLKDFPAVLPERRFADSDGYKYERGPNSYGN